MGCQERLIWGDDTWAKNETKKKPAPQRLKGKSTVAAYVNPWDGKAGHVRASENE